MIILILTRGFLGRLLSCGKLATIEVADSLTTEGCITLPLDARVKVC